jgi:hypothetical protein
MLIKFKIILKNKIMNIKETPIPKNQYYPEIQTKTQIVLHHTVSDPKSPLGDINSWLSDTLRISTYAIVGYDGTINKCFPSNNWANHLGVKSDALKAMGFKDAGSRNELLNKQTIAIEIDAWGGLTYKDGKYLNAYGKPIASDLEVVECKWRGFTHFQKYSKAQIQALSELLPELMKANNIPNYGIKDGNLDVRLDALKGEKGIFSHSSYRKDKSDLYPDKDLINMLNNLKIN